jgi:pectate lyase
VFDVSGVFRLGRTAVAGWDANSNGWDTASRLDIPSDVTIAGQTAPGPVIIMGGTVKPGGNNIILRNVTFAPGYGNRSFNEPTRVPVAGDFPDSYTYDALDISGQNVMIDHVTTVYGTDETISMNELANNITVQYCDIAQGQNYPQADAEAAGVSYTGHSLGSLLQAGSNAKISILHNLYAHLKGRLPRVGTEATVLTVTGVGAANDLRNNVYYNWFGTAGTGASGQPSQNNFINNFYLAGPGGDDAAGGTSTAITTAAGGTSIFNGSDVVNTKVYHAGNLKDINKDADANDTTALVNADFGTSSIQTAAFTQTPYYGVTDTASAAYARVLDFAGARWWSRAAIDLRITNEVRTGTGRIVAWADDPFNSSATEGVEWRSLSSTLMTSRPTGFDTDNDGMPNEWELAHGLDPNVADNNGDFDADGYTNLEEYINEISAWPAAAQLLFKPRGNIRYAEITNWNVGAAASNTGSSTTAYWQPSKYDLALIQAGTAVVDAVGQHAGTLQVAAPNAVATLNVVAGWIEIAGELDVGFNGVGRRQGRQGRQGRIDGTRTGGGRVTQTGGVLTAKQAVVIGGGHARGGSHTVAVHTLAGGALNTPLLVKGTAAGAKFAFTGGALHAGTVGFDLVDEGGVIAPGGSGTGTGHTEVRGDLAIKSGALEIDLDGPASDTVGVTGTARLGGALEVKLRDGFAPKPGDSWTILVAARGITGQFQSIPKGYAVRTVGKRLILSFGGLPPVITSML